MRTSIEEQISDYWENGRELLLQLRNLWKGTEYQPRFIHSSSSNQIMLSMTTDRTVFESTKLQAELSRLRNISQGSSMSYSMIDEDAIATKFEDISLNLTGHNLPQDIVTKLIEAVPICEGSVFTSHHATALSRSCNHLLAARSLLAALPLWEVYTQQTNILLAAEIMFMTQMHLINEAIIPSQDIFESAWLSSRTFGVSQYTCQFIKEIEYGVYQILATRMPNHIDHNGQRQLLEKFLDQIKRLGDALEKHRRQRGMSEMQPGTEDLDRILELPPVYFLLYTMPTDNSATQPPHQSKSIENSMIMPTQKLLEKLDRRMLEFISY